MVEAKAFEEMYRLPRMEHEQGSIGFLEKLFIAQFLFAARPKIVVETGSFKGQTTKFVSQFLSMNDMDGVLYSFDLPGVIDGILASDGFFRNAANVRFVGGSLPETLTECLAALEDKVGFAIVDSEHSHRQVTAELTALDPLLKEGAYVFCHDYLPDNPVYAGVVRAVGEFAAKHRYDLLPLLGHGIWGAAVLRKPDAPAPGPLSGVRAAS